LVLAAATTLMAMTWFQVACLELARTLTRIREIGVRLSLGATRGALAIESLCQGSALALGAILVSAIALPALLSMLLRLLPAELSLGQPIAADWRALLFGALLALGVVGAFAVVPLQALVRVDTTYLLRGSTGNRRTRVTAPWIIVMGQVALSTALVYVAALTVRSMSAVSHVDFGYSPTGIVIVRLPDRKAEGAASADYERVLERLRSRPTVAAVAGSSGRPLGGPTTIASVGRPGERQGVRARMVCVTPGYFRTLGVPLLGGRDFDASDTRTSGFALVVNRSLARRLGLARWEGGSRLTLQGLPAALIGMVGDTVLTRPDDPDQEFVFVPTTQWTPATYLIARSEAGTGGQTRAFAEISAVLRQMAPPGSYSVVALAEEAKRVTAPYRARMLLLLTLATIGITLCGTGVYGAVTYAWESLRRTVAIRLALGASPDLVRAHLLQKVASRVLTGLAIGVGGGTFAGRVGAAILFGITPFDPVAVAATVSTMAVACACAVVPPTVRIGRVQPSEVLREE
jgi:ABC-type antimicrobial peptide transport system permease subunit